MDRIYIVRLRKGSCTNGYKYNASAIQEVQQEVDETLCTFALSSPFDVLLAPL